MIDTLKILIRWILFVPIDFLLKSHEKPTSKTLLLLRLDAIGDYVLFRNFIELIRESEKYKNYKITLCGNMAWKELAEGLDAEFVDDFIWVDIKKLNRNLFYRYKKIKELTAKSYEVIISPTFSREFFYSDNLVKLLSADEKIGSIGDLANIKKWQKKISDRYYTWLIPAKDSVLFEFERNREFFENLFGSPCTIKKPKIVLAETSPAFPLPKNYVVLFIGASKAFRKWPIASFVEVAVYLKEKFGLAIVLCGGSSEKTDSAVFASLFNGEYIDLVGKTSLLEFLDVIKNGTLLVTNETSAPHFAVALDSIQAIVISNGNNFLRFTPYPEEISKKYHVIFHPEIEKDFLAYAKYCKDNPSESTLDVGEISVSRVLHKIDELMLPGGMN